MAFAILPKDLFVLLTAIKVGYDGWKTAPGVYSEVAMRLHDFERVVKRFDTMYDASFSSKNGEPKKLYHNMFSQDDYDAMIEGCQAVVNSLNRMMERYSSAQQNGTSSVLARHWDRLGLADKSQDIAKLQQRLIAQSTSLSALEQANPKLALMQIGCDQRQLGLIAEEQLALLANVTQRLEDIFRLVEQTHRRQVNDLDRSQSRGRDRYAQMNQPESEPREWRRLRQELTSLGFDPTLLSEFEEQIKTFFLGLQFRHPAINSHASTNNHQPGSKSDIDPQKLPSDPLRMSSLLPTNEKLYRDGLGTQDCMVYYWKDISTRWLQSHAYSWEHSRDRTRTRVLGPLSVERTHRLLTSYPNFERVSGLESFDADIRSMLIGRTFT